MMLSQQLAGHLLLFGRQASVERFKYAKQTRGIVGASLGELLAQLKALHGVHCITILPHCRNCLIERFRVIAHCRSNRLPLRLLSRRDLELGLQEGNTALDKSAGHSSVMVRFALCRRRVCRSRSGLRHSGTQTNRGDGGKERSSKKWRMQPDHFALCHEKGLVPLVMIYGPHDCCIPVQPAHYSDLIPRHWQCYSLGPIARAKTVCAGTRCAA